MDASGVQGTHTPVLPRSERNSPVQNPWDEQPLFLLVVPLSCRRLTPFPSFYFFSLCLFKAVLKLRIHMHLAFTSCPVSCRTGETGKWGLRLPSVGRLLAWIYPRTIKGSCDQLYKSKHMSHPAFCRHAVKIAPWPSKGRIKSTGGETQGHIFGVVIFLCRLVVGPVTPSDKSPHEHDETAMPNKAAFHVTTTAALGSDPCSCCICLIPC